MHAAIPRCEKRVPRVLLINANTTRSVTDLIEHHARKAIDKDVEIRAVTAAFGAPYVSTEAAYAVAGHAALDCLQRHAKGCDAVLLACFGDPGLFALREQSELPVLHHHRRPGLEADARAPCGGARLRRCAGKRACAAAHRAGTRLGSFDDSRGSAKGGGGRRRAQRHHRRRGARRHCRSHCGTGRRAADRQRRVQRASRGEPVLAFVIRRLAYVIPISLAVSAVCFALVFLAPGDPLSAVMPADASADLVEKLKVDYGFDKPIPVQFGKWGWRALHDGLGMSLATGRPVNSEIARAISNTSVLAFFACSICFTLGLVLGTVAGYFHGTWIDKTVTAIAVTGVSVPHYWLGMVLVILFPVLYPVRPPLGLGPAGSPESALGSVRLPS